MRVYPIFNLFLVEFCACFALSVEAKRFQDYGQHVADPRSGHSNFAADDTADQPAQAGQRLHDGGRGMSTSTDDVHEERGGGFKGLKNFFRKEESSSTSAEIDQWITDIPHHNEPNFFEPSYKAKQLEEEHKNVYVATPEEEFSQMGLYLNSLSNDDVWEDDKGKFVKWMKFCAEYTSERNTDAGKEVMKMEKLKKDVLNQFAFATFVVKAASEFDEVHDIAETMLTSIFTKWKNKKQTVGSYAKAFKSVGADVKEKYKLFLVKELEREKERLSI